MKKHFPLIVISSTIMIATCAFCTSCSLFTGSKVKIEAVTSEDIKIEDSQSICYLSVEKDGLNKDYYANIGAFSFVINQEFKANYSISYTIFADGVPFVSWTDASGKVIPVRPGRVSRNVKHQISYRTYQTYYNRASLSYKIEINGWKYN